MANPDMRWQVAAGGWLNYPLEANKKMAQCYAEGAESCKIQLEVDGRLMDYTMNFVRNVQITDFSKKERPIRPPYESPFKKAVNEPPPEEVKGDVVQKVDPNLKKNADIAEGRKLIKECMEKTKDTKGKDQAMLTSWKEECLKTIDVAAGKGLGEEELRPLKDRVRKVHNAIQDLRGAIRVFCRTRPPNQRERDMGSKSCLAFSPDRMGVSVTLEDGEEHEFSFDSTFNPGTQLEVFQDLKELVQSCMDGYNVTVFAYGQTGAGKTFTMYGPITNGDALNNKDSGVVINAIKHLFVLKKEYEATSEVSVQVCMIELYCSKLSDLLHKGEGKALPINIRKATDGEVIFENTNWISCDSAEQLWGSVHGGFTNRHVTATAMNAESSRSHLILTIKTNIKNKTTQAVIKSKLTLVDLAGSERVKDSKVEGQALAEAIEINKSLTCLGDVMEQLVKPKKGQQVGYRNSKLTECLQDSLGGSAKTLMFANVSPATVNSGETLMTMKWAQRANSICNETQVNCGEDAETPADTQQAKPKAAAKKSVAKRK
eukprot:GEMP01017914.1.p1 GENE.GEMP01017914.1~~GEMP01017914.1.p1  ORF type:complete len:544 (+),score=100.31 GEMP01017914.1:111-1742(+)